MRYIVPIVVVFIFFSCQRELNYAGIPVPVDTSFSGSSNDTSYQPVAVQSYWKYRSSNPAGEIKILTATAQIQQIENKNFTVFGVETSGQPASTAYISKLDSSYELRGIFNRMNFARPNVSGGLIYLQHPNKAKAGDSWEYDAGIASNMLPAKIRGTVMSTGNSLTVAGHLYNNVIVTKLQVLYKLHIDSGFENFQTYYFYVAKAVGIIRTESQSSGGGTDDFNAVEELIEYRIR